MISERGTTAGGPGRRYWGQRVLVAAIRWYRDRLSGRGPLRRVRCTFARTESCSQYGLRVASEVADSPTRALALIRGRIRRCGAAAVYRVPLAEDTVSTGRGNRAPGRALLWGETYRRPGWERDRELDAAGELPATRAASLRAHAAIAHYRGQTHAARRCLSAAASIADAALPDSRSSVAQARLAMRDGRQLDTYLRRRLVTGLIGIGAAWLVIAIILAAVAAPWWLVAATIAPAGLVLWSRTRRDLRRLRRFAQQRAASRFARPLLYVAEDRAGQVSTAGTGGLG